MSDYDLLIAGGRSAETEAAVDVAIVDGVIADIGPDLPGSARERIDATGLVVLPGAIDPHLHFNEPGLHAGSEGFVTGSAALAVGGVTTAIEMPLSARPAVTSVAAFDIKLAAVGHLSRVDFALWGGLVPGNLDQLEPLAQRGVAGFKAFMSDTATEDFPAADDLTLYEGMTRIAGTGRLLAVHAESDTITRELTARAVTEGRLTVRDYLQSRPAIAETEAIARAIELAAAAGCPLHIVHVSTGRGVMLVTEARQRGIDVTCEVTAHHLVFTDEDAERLGALAKCAPPLRDAGQVAALWHGLADGKIAFVVSDHSPATPENRTGDPFTAWGGITGCQSTLEVLLTEGYDRGRLTLAQIADRLAGGAARRFGLAPAKGSLAVGADADMVLVRLGEVRILEAEELRYRHRFSPYVGHRLTARVIATVLRGELIYRDGELIGEPRGRLVTPVSALAI